MSAETLSPLLSDQWTRLKTWYYIIDDSSNVIKFKPNWLQEALYKNLHYMNIILKARQMGVTTFFAILFLDSCLYNRNVTAGIIAHHKDDAEKIFRRKIKFAYERLPEEIKKMIPVKVERTTEMEFANGSSISVATSFRSGTVNLLLVSEHGKICRKYPDKAEEIKTGAFNAVHSGQFIAIESTAEGRAGDFYEMCMRARNAQLAKRPLTPLDFKFFFYPWFRHPSYRISSIGEIIPAHLKEYFDSLKAKYNVILTREQMVWYTKKYELLSDKMKQEYPSTPEEAFEASIIGAYFNQQMTDAYSEGRICSVPWDRSVPVDTWWDIGMNDSTSIWFSQKVGREIHLIEYYENSGEGLEHYIKYCLDKKYWYGRHVGPHDLDVRELGTGISRIDTARSLGVSFDVVPRVNNKMESIEAARRLIPLCWFDAEKCSIGISHLERYRKKYNEKLGIFMDKPVHDNACHGADAFQTLAMGKKEVEVINAIPVVRKSMKGWT